MTERSRGHDAARRALRALIVEDREDDLLLLLDELDRGGYDVTYTRVDKLTTLRDALASSDFDIVLSDFSLPTMTADDVLPVVQALRHGLPCIVLSGSITEEAAVSLLRAGARDFVVKGRMSRLVPAIERELREATERRKLLVSEAALQETRERMQFALEAVGIGTWEAFPADGRTIWSDVTERLHGMEPGSFDGTTEAFIDAIHPDDRQTVIEHIAGAQASTAPFRLEYRCAWPDGSVHSLVGIGRVLPGESGSAIRVVGVSMDVTAQKRLEEQVRQTQKMESIGNLAGGVAHDFNNLLTVILGECELIMPRLAGDPETIGSLESILGAATSASALTRQLLTFSRRQVVVPRVIDLDGVVRDFQKILRRLVEENVHLEFQLAPGSRHVRVDPGQIEQVLLNLVANARDAMPDGGTVMVQTRTVTIDASDDDAVSAGAALIKPGEYAELSVVDSGDGMTPEVKAHLFEPFFTTKPVGRGTGLGLATVHGIITEGGGHLAVDSEPGAGTTIRLRLPLAQASAHPPPPVEPGVRTEVGGETVLIVEDSAPLRQLTQRMLERLGYRVLLASNALEAERVFAAHQDVIDVVLADIVMPDGSGLAVAASLIAQREDLRVVFMSGYTADHDEVAGKSYLFLQKPFSSAQLATAVRAALSGQPCGQSPDDAR